MIKLAIIGKSDRIRILGTNGNSIDISESQVGIRGIENIAGALTSPLCELAAWEPWVDGIRP